MLETTYITQFSAMLDTAEQQMQSRLTPIMDIFPINGDNFAYDGIGSVEGQRANGNNVRIQPTDINTNRRKLARQRIVTAVLVDEREVRAVMADPKGKLALMCNYAHERERDRVGYEQMFADVLTGREFGTTVTFADDGGQTVDATAGLTYEKLLEMTKNFIDYEVDTTKGTFLGITGDEHTDLMSEAELTSGDYTRQFAIDKGQIQYAAGHKLITFGASVSNPILGLVSAERISFCAIGKALAFGVSSARKITAQPHPDYVESTLIKVVEEVGAVRTQGVRIQKVRLTP